MQRNVFPTMNNYKGLTTKLYELVKKGEIYLYKKTLYSEVYLEKRKRYIIKVYFSPRSTLNEYKAIKFLEKEKFSYIPPYLSYKKL